MSVKRLCRKKKKKKKKVHFVIGYAYVNHCENGVNYTCSYWKFTRLSHGTIRTDLSFIVFEQLMIYYNNVIKNFILANFNSLYWTSFPYLCISELTMIKYIYSPKKRNFIFYDSSNNKAVLPG